MCCKKVNFKESKEFLNANHLQCYRVKYIEFIMLVILLGFGIKYNIFTHKKPYLIKDRVLQ